MNERITIRSRRRRAHAGSGRYLALVATVAFLLTTLAWMAQERAGALPDTYQEAVFPVTGLH